MFHCTSDDDRMKRRFNFKADRLAGFVSKAWIKTPAGLFVVVSVFGRSFRAASLCLFLFLASRKLSGPGVFMHEPQILVFLSSDA